MNIAICDDDNISIEHLSSLCRGINFIDTITAYISPETLLTDIHAGVVFDVVIMDIDFEAEKNGIDYAEEIYHISPLIRTIYITGYTERFVQLVFLKKSTLVGFITKPAQKNILENLLKKAQNEIDNDKCNLIFARGKGLAESISCRSILYLESTGHKVLIHTENNSTVYSVYDRLSAFLKKLPSNFQQCHKSYLINMDKIKRIDKREIQLSDGTCIQISKSYATKLKERYMQYMQKSL